MLVNLDKTKDQWANFWHMLPLTKRQTNRHIKQEKDENLAQ